VCVCVCVCVGVRENKAGVRALDTPS